MAVKNPQPASGMFRFVRCGVGNESYGVDMSWVRGIQRTDQFRANPEKGSLVGWLSAPAGDIGVFSLESLLGKPPRRLSSEARIIVLNPPTTALTLAAQPPLSEQGPWGLWVEQVSRVIQVSTDHLVPLPPIAVDPCVNYFRGIVRMDEDLILLLAPDELHGLAYPLPEKARESVQPRQAPSGFAERLGRLAERKKSADQGGQILVFSPPEPVSNGHNVSFALSVSQVPEVLNPKPVTPVPGAPPFLLGLVNWRNNAVPLVDLAARLGLPSHPDAAPSDAAPSETLPNVRTRLMIARDTRTGSEVYAGFLVSPTIRSFHLPLVHKPCEHALPIRQHLTRGAVELETETLVIPDIGGILQPGL